MGPGSWENSSLTKAPAGTQTRSNAFCSSSSVTRSPRKWVRCGMIFAILKQVLPPIPRAALFEYAVRRHPRGPQKAVNKTTKTFVMIRVFPQPPPPTTSTLASFPHNGISQRGSFGCSPADLAAARRSRSFSQALCMTSAMQTTGRI